MKKFIDLLIQTLGSYKLISIVFLINLLALTPSSKAQELALEAGTFFIKPTINKNKQEISQQIMLRIKLSGAKPSKDLVVELKLSDFRQSKIDLKLSSEKIFIKLNDWPGEGEEKIIQQIVNVIHHSVDSFGFDEVVYLTLDSVDEESVNIAKTGNIEIRTTTIGSYDQNKSFWVEVGANFDLVDGLEPNNFFSGVFFYKRDIEKLSKRSSGKRLGIFAGVFESKTITDQTEEPLALRKYFDTTSIIGGDERLKVFTAIGSRIKRTTVKNIGLFFSPQVRLTGHSANEDGLHLFLSGWAELQWQRVLEEKSFNSYSILRTDSLPVIDVLGNPEFFNKNERKEVDVRSHYFGVGLPVFFKETVGNNLVQLFLNPVAGITSQPTEQYLVLKSMYDFDPIKYPQPIKKWSPFYVIQFRLNEENYGIAFTGEVRGLLKKDNKPYVSLALSKKFDLTKFIEFNKR